MIEGKFRQNLQELRNAVESADGAAIASLLRQLDELMAEHGRELDPQLFHFLQRRSYEKALTFLGGDRDIPAGKCGGKS